MENEYQKLIDYIQDNQEKLYRLAYSYMKNEYEALDVVQESVYKAIKSYDKLKNKSHYRTWLYRIIVNTSITSLRKSKRLVLVRDVEMELETESVEYEGVMDLHDAIEQLDDDQKTLIRLRFFSDLKIDEVAAVLDLNVNTVKTRLYKTLGVLRKTLGSEV